MTSIYVTRHGETEYNILHRLTGKTDIPLTENGTIQAQTIAKKLEAVPFDVIISSPLSRALKTAEIIGSYHKSTPIITHNGLEERHMGVCEGMEYDKAVALYPTLSILNSVPNLDDAPPEGESLRSFDSRVGEALESILNEFRGKTILLVCHGLTSRIINRRLNGLSLSEASGFLLDNCETIKYETD